MSCQEGLKNLRLPSLEYRRERVDLIEVYKIMNNIDQIEQETYLLSLHAKQLEGTNLNSLRNNIDLRFGRTVLIDTWNALPENVVMGPS